jgi:flagellar assembly protein FliH
MTSLPSVPADSVSRDSGFAAWPLPELRMTIADEPRSLSEPLAPSAADLAFEEGVEQGRRQAADELEARTGRALAALAGAAQSLRTAHDLFAAELEDNLYALAVAVAQQIVEREVAADPGIVRDLVRRAVDVLPLDNAIEIRLHPEDLAALGGQIDLYVNGGRRLEVQWAADATIERGGYIVETPQRVVDGRVDEALRALYERLRDD